MKERANLFLNGFRTQFYQLFIIKVNSMVSDCPNSHFELKSECLVHPCVEGNRSRMASS